MIISSPNHCWCCHTLQHTAFPMGTSQPPSWNQFLFYHHLPRKLKWILITLLLFDCWRNTSNPEDGISQNTSFFFLFCSLLPNQWQELQKQVNNALWEPTHPSHINLKTLSKQILEYDNLGAKVKKIPSSNNGCREGKTKPSPPQWSQQPLSVVVISLFTLLCLPCFISSMNSVAEHCKASPLSETCHCNIMEQAQPRRKYWCSAWPEGVK